MREDQMSLWYRKKDLCQIMDFACPYHERANTKELEKIEHYQEFGNRVEKNMEYESQAYATSDRCSRNNTHKVQKLVKGNRY